MGWIMFTVKDKYIRTTSTLTDSLVDFEQVNVCWGVIKRLSNEFWSVLKMLCIKCCTRLSNFYWHNALKYTPFLNKNAGNTFTYFILKKINQSWNKIVQLETSKTKKGKSKLHVFFFFILNLWKWKGFFYHFSPQITERIRI